MASKVVSVGDIVATLCGFETEPFTRDRILAYLADVEVDRASLEPYTHYCADRYTRNLVHVDSVFELMALCWQPGQRTPIHSHNGQLGWMITVRGALAVVEYKYVGCNAPENQQVSGLDCLAGATEIELERGSVHECAPGGPVATVDKTHTIHQVVVQGREPALSLHLYSRPIESCVAYDLKARRCWRRPLSFHSRYGRVVAEVEPPAPAAAAAPAAVATGRRELPVRR